MKGQDHTGATVSAQGRLVISQADEATYSCIFPKEFGETLITTSFKYEDGSLCAVFPQLVSGCESQTCKFLKNG